MPLGLGHRRCIPFTREFFATTFADLKNDRVFDVLPGRSAKALHAFVAALQGRERVRVVCIDLSSPYRALIRQWFPNARIVADRFHVIRVVIHHFMTLARQIAPDIKNHRGSTGIVKVDLAHSNGVFCK